MGRVQRHKRIKDLKAWVDRPEHLKIDHSKDAKLPRSFRNFLQIQKLATQPPKPKPKSQPATTPTTTDKTLKKKSSSSSSTSTTTTADTSDSPHLKPLSKIEQREGESLEDFSRRVDRAARRQLTQNEVELPAEVKPMRPSRKQYFQRKLERKKRKRDDDEQLDFDDLRDSVEFGEVADRPPELPQLPAKLKAVPKKPSAASTLPRSMTQKADEVMLKYKQRAADGSGLSGRVLDIERAKAIGNYRVAKKRKRLASTDVSLGDE